MPHLCLVAFVGFRVREAAMRELGMSMPGLEARAGAVALLPALGLLTLAGMTPEPWTVSYHECDRTSEGLMDEVLSRRPDLVAVSALTASITEAYRWMVDIRRRGVPVVTGGLHVTACPDEAGRFADAVVVGDGESVWREVLADVLASGLRTRYGPGEPWDLARSPVPRFDLVADRPRPRWTLQTERGCPLACDFCGASRLLGGFREKPVDRIREELTAIRALDPKPVIELADDNTFAGRRSADELFEVLGNAGVRYFTEADWRIGETPGLADGLARSGCVQVLVGLESPVHRHDGQGGKAAPMERMMDSVRAIQEAGVCVIGCFILGSDGETRQSLDALGDFLEESPLADVQLTLQTPFPGTALRRRLAREGRLLPDRGWEHHTLFDVAFRPDRMTVVELETGFRELVKRVFVSDASSRRRRIRKETWRRSRVSVGGDGT